MTFRIWRLSKSLNGEPSCPSSSSQFKNACLLDVYVVRELLDEVFFGDGPLLFIVEMFVSDGEIYARPHGYVECADSIRGQKLGFLGSV